MRHNTIYPKRWIAVEGDIVVGFTFYGPFTSHDKAWAWVTNNMHESSSIKVTHMFDIRDELLP